MHLYGASGHGKVVAEIAEITGEKIDGFIDKDISITVVWKYPVFHFFPENVEKLIISIGNNKIRSEISKWTANTEFGTLIHPSSEISSRAFIDKGTVIMANTSINSEAKIGKHCILNTACSIDHECEIADYVHISPLAAIAGGVKIGEGTHIGIGAVIIQGITIGKWCTIGAGAVIIKDVPDGVTVVGNPGRIIKP